MDGANPGAARWDSTDEDDFKFFSLPIANEQDHTLTMIISFASQNDQATFMICYYKQLYDNSLWKCTIQPPSYQVGWNAFKKAAAGDETAPKLLPQHAAAKF